MHKVPKFSIVIPSYNQGRFIERTIRSILRNGYDGPIEIIVSDGGSKDETVSILKKFGDKIIWWSEKDKGFVDGVNKGLAVATGDFIGIQSSDDYYVPGALARAASMFEKASHAVFVTGDRIFVDENLSFKGISTHAGIYTIGSIFERLPGQDSTFARAEVVRNVGSLPPEVEHFGDHYLWMKCLCQGVGLSIPFFQSICSKYDTQRTKTLVKHIVEDLKKLPDLLRKDETFPSSLRSDYFLELGSIRLQSFWLRSGGNLQELRRLHSEAVEKYGADLVRMSGFHNERHNRIMETLRTARMSCRNASKTIIAKKVLREFRENILPT